jgi:hypothetical protein
MEGVGSLEKQGFSPQSRLYNGHSRDRALHLSEKTTMSESLKNRILCQVIPTAQLPKKHRYEG